MGPDVRLRNGVEVEFESGETVVLDGTGDGEAAVVSHAHGDHLIRNADTAITSRLTADLAAVRSGDDAPDIADHPAIALHDAGHIAGSRAATLTDPDTGRTVLYTGDCCTRDRFYLDGFDPPVADTLVIEATYGTPEYRFPPIDEAVAEIHNWLEATMDTVVILFGYALGRAQKLQRILAGSPRQRVFVPDAVARLNDVIEEHRDVAFGGRRYGSDVDLEPGDAVVLPPGATRQSWFESLMDRHDAVTAGFSGWAVDRSFVYRRGYDEGFVLSDHCDFDELVQIVETVDPDRVYTHHGFAVEFADYLATERGYEARALKRHQSTLADF